VANFIITVFDNSTDVGIGSDHVKNKLKAKTTTWTFLLLSERLIVATNTALTRYMLLAIIVSADILPFVF
jgi:hypothetical protein